MQPAHEMIAAKLGRSAFSLTFETDEIIAYRSSSQGNVLRAVYINLEQRAVEYELTQEDLPTRNRVEYFPTLAHLIEKLPVTIDSFDLKFQGLKLKEDEGATAQVRNRVPLGANNDPWDPTNYFDNPHTGKPHVVPGLRPVDKKPK